MTDSTSASDSTQTWPFFMLAVGATLLLQAPLAAATHGLIAGTPEQFLPIAMLGTFSPLVAALVLSRRAPGGIRALFSTLKPTSAPLGWTLVALAIFPLTYVVAAAVSRAAGGTDAAWLYLPETSQHVVAMILIPLIEETGWRGYALPRLLKRYDAITATLILGVAWAAWHVMMFLFATSSPAEFSVALANIFVGTFVFTWLSLRTKNSLWIAVIAHAGAHLNNPSHAHPLVAPMAIYTLGLAVLCGVLLAVDRQAWRSRASA